MRKRLIAALVIAALAWLNVPVSLAMTTASQEPSQQTSNKQDHSCCPRFHLQLLASLFVVIPPSEIPCGDQHPCCAKQGPENLPALATRTRVEGHKPYIAAVSSAAPKSDARVVRKDFPKKFLLSYSVRSTVLRI